MATTQTFVSQPYIPTDAVSTNMGTIAATPDEIMQRYLSAKPSPDQDYIVAASQTQVKQRFLPTNAAPSQRSEPQLWALINSYFPKAGPDFQFWWRTTGIPFAVLLQKAGYSTDAQCQHLLFYYSCVVPELGAGPNPQGLPKQWRSFMTDHFAPIELSWEWGCGGGESPTVRFSIEPISPHAGTPADPLNEFATNRLVRQYQPLLADCDLTIFDHFSDRLLSYNCTPEEADAVPKPQGHLSRTFVAFELNKDGVMLKAYFLPTFRAAELKQSNWTTIVQSIEALPNYSPSTFQGLSMIQNYLDTSQQGPGIEAEIFAVDCIIPTQSRLKIYVRSRSTNFDSVRDVLTLGGVFDDPLTARGLSELERLWKLVLAVGPDFSTADELEQKEHRTAGILYYFDIKQAKAKPGVKVYIPVRHYGSNDIAITEGLTTYLEGRGQGQFARKYVEALKNISPGSSLRDRCGMQTYLGCSIVKGELKLTSYIAPIVYNRVHRRRSSSC